MGRKHNKLSDQIRQAVDASGLSRYALCKVCGMDQGAFSRFMHRKVGLQLSTLDRLIDVLDLELTHRKKTPTKRATKGR